MLPAPEGGIVADPPAPVVPPAPDEPVPVIAAGPRIFARVIQRVVVGCPKCRRDLDVTHVAVGMAMTCPAQDCGNVTWRPEIQPHWWFPIRNFVLATLGSFVLGVVSSVAASWVWEKIHTPLAQQQRQPESATAGRDRQ
jgi:hypothetical protein